MTWIPRKSKTELFAKYSRGLTLLVWVFGVEKLPVWGPGSEYKTLDMKLADRLSGLHMKSILVEKQKSQSIL